MRAAGDQIFRLGLAAIPYRDRESGIEVAAGHAVTHAPEPDECDTRHGLIHILDGGRQRAECALRQGCRHELVEVPVEHP